MINILASKLAYNDKMSRIQLLISTVPVAGCYVSKSLSSVGVGSEVGSAECAVL